MATCVDCGKGIKRFPFKCPACKTIRCFHCMDEHLKKAICAYGKRDKIAVRLGVDSE